MRSATRLFLLLMTCCLAFSVWAEPAFKPSGHYLRTQLDGDVVRLDVATRVLVPIQGDGPTVMLVGAIHVGEPGYYAMLQALLDAQDLVLYEGVRPADTEADDPVAVTTRRLKALAAVTLAYHEQHGDWPASIDELFDADAGLSAIQRRMARAASIDAWGNAVGWSVAGINTDHGARPIGVLLTSLGDDGRPGGEGLAADVSVSTAEVAEDLDGAIQLRLARLLDLGFQGQHILTDQATWQNSDMDWSQVQAALEQEGSVTGQVMTSLMDGDNPLLEQFIRGMEQFINASPMIKTSFKLMLVTQLSQAETLGAQLDPGMQKVIIEARNQVVVDDLERVLTADDAPASIAVFYGAGHMADLEERLFDQFGYRVVGGLWVPAIHFDLTAQGLSDRDLEQVRQQVRGWGEEAE
ncbi:MAG: hypothetical protein AAGC44_10560 [Planctomycetota bacterium]